MFHRTACLFALLAAVALLGGCSDSTPAPQGSAPDGPQLDVNPAPPVDAHAGHEHGEEQGDDDAIHEIMETLNKGKESPTKRIGAALEADPVDWQTIRGLMPQYVELSSKLPDATPPQGPPASWKTLATAYAESAKALQSAVKLENAMAARTAHTALTNSCKPCHNVHRP